MSKRGLFERLISYLKRTPHHGWIQGRPSPKRGKPSKIYIVEEKLQILKELEESGAPITIFAK